MDLLRRVLVVSSVFVLALVFAACGGDDDGGGDGGGSGSGEGPVEIAVIGSQSGPAAYLGSSQQHGIDLAVEELNADGGVLGRELVPVYRDDALEPEQAVSQLRALLRDDPAAVFGSSTTASSQAIIPLAMQEEKIIFPGSAETSLIDAAEYPFAFRAYLTDEANRLATVEYLLAEGVGSVAVFATDDTYGSGVAETLVPALEEAGIEVPVDTRFKTGAPSLDPQAIQARNAGADAVFVASAVAGDQANFAKALSGANVDSILMGTPTILASNFQELAGPAGDDALGFTYETLTYGADGEASAEVEQWLVDLSEIGDTSDDLLVINAYWYDMVKVWAAAAEEAGSFETADVVAALEQTTDFPGIQGPITFTAEQHDGLAEDALAVVRASTYRDGLFERVE